MNRQATRQQQIADLLLQLFLNDAYVINREALESLIKLDASPMNLRMQPETLLGLMQDDGFPAGRFVRDVLKGFRINYLRTRAALNQQAEVDHGEARTVQGQYNEVCVEIGSLVFALIPYGYMAEDEVEAYLDSDDSWLNSFGAQMLGRFPMSRDSHVEKILVAMEQNGVNEHPFHLGLALASRLDESTAHYPYLCERFRTGNDNLKSGILQTFYDVKKELPMQVQQLILETALAQENDGDASNLSMSVIALAKCPQLRGEALEFLARCLGSKNWYIRGNAAVSLSMLDIDDPKLIDHIGDLIFDSEGNDWSVSSASLAALIQCGVKAKPMVPRLLKLAKDTLPEADFNGYPCINRLLAEAFGACGDSSPEVIEALRKIVEKQGYISAFPAVCALGKLGAASLPALETVGKYLFGAEMPADSDASATKLIIALIEIAGHEHSAVTKFIEHLCHSPFDEVRAIAENHWARAKPK